MIPFDKYRVPEPSLDMSYKEVGKFVAYDSQVNYKALELAFGDMYDMFYLVCRDSRLYSYDEIVATMTYTTSPGWPYTSPDCGLGQHHTKQSVLEDPRHRQRWEDYCTAFDVWVTNGDKFRVPVVYTAQLKEEVRKAEKPARNFQSGPMDFHMLRAKLLYDQCEQLIQCNTGRHKVVPPLHTWYNPGFNHYYGNWGRLHDKLCAVAGQSGRVVAYDFSGWDRSVTHKWLMYVSALEWLFIRDESRTEDLRKLMLACTDAMIHGLVMMEDGALYRTGVGMKSGDFCTTKHNTFVHILAVKTALYTIALEKGVDRVSASRYVSQDVFFQMAGDDGIGAMAACDWCSPEELRDKMIGQGFRFKSFVSVPPSEVIASAVTHEPIEFCSKTFTRRNGAICGKADMTKQLCKLVFGETAVNAKMSFMRIMSIRRDAWPDPQSFQLLSDYAEQFVRDHERLLKEPQEGDIDTWATCLANWDSPLKLQHLHTGMESGSSTDHAVGTDDVRRRFKSHAEARQSCSESSTPARDGRPANPAATQPDGDKGALVARAFSFARQSEQSCPEPRSEPSALQVGPPG